MPPDVTNAPTGVLFEGETVDPTVVKDSPKKEVKYTRQLVWRNLIIFAYLHLGALYGLYLIFTSAKLATTLFGTFSYILFHFEGKNLTILKTDNISHKQEPRKKLFHR